MNTKDIPCIKDKCILLPVCKSKDDIICDNLFDYSNEMRQYDHDKLWTHVKIVLPNIQLIQHPKLPYGLGISIYSSEQGPVKIIHKEPISNESSKKK